MHFISVQNYSCSNHKRYRIAYQTQQVYKNLIPCIMFDLTGSLHKPYKMELILIFFFKFKLCFIKFTWMHSKNITDIWYIPFILRSYIKTVVANSNKPLLTQIVIVLIYDAHVYVYWMYINVLVIKRGTINDVTTIREQKDRSNAHSVHSIILNYCIYLNCDMLYLCQY